MHQDPPDTPQADLLAGVLDSSLNGIMAFQSLRDGEGRVIDFVFTVVNRTAEQVVGMSADELRGQRLLDKLPGNKTDGLFDAYVNVVETGEPFLTEHHYAHDGLNSWFSIRATRCGDGFTVTFEDITAHVETGQQIRLAKERFELMIAGNACGVWDWDCQTGDLYWSPRFKALLGYAEDEIDPVYDDFEQRLHPDDKATTLDRLANHLDRSGVYDVEYRLKHKDGHYVWCHASGQAQWDDDGKPIRMAGSIEDISERKASEHELRKLSLVASRTEDGVVVADAQGRIEWTNRAFTTITGYTLDELRGKRPGDVLQGPDTDPETVRRIREGLAQEAGFRERILNYHKSGEAYWVEIEVQPVHNEAGEVINYIAIERDVTEQLSREQTLELERRRLAFSLDASRSGLWDWRVVTGETYFSDSWYTMLGYEPGELPMHVDSWVGISEPGDFERAKAALDAYFRGETDRYVCEMRVKNKAGQWQWIMDVGEAVERDDAGSVTRMIGLHLDIHELKLAQLELEKAHDAAQQANTAKSAFIANMSHEIRTPMNAILGFADLLLDHDQSEADRRNHAVTIRRNGRHLMDLLNDVLDISKIEADKMSIERVACAPGKILQDVITLMMPQAMQKGIELILETPEPLPDRMKTDPTRVKQVLLNLIGNAIKFTDEGSVRVVVRHAPEADGTAGLTCAVIDTGIGIGKDQRERLFQPFSQADESTTRKFGGTGLGLAISSRLCRLLGGELACESTPGVGSTFTAHLRVEQVERSPESGTQLDKRFDHRDHSLAGRRVLVVDDAPDNQRLIRHYLVKADGVVTLAENGADARDAALSAEQGDEPFDIVLMDMQMPVLDGYEATRQLRESGYTRPIVALTAHASADDREKCLAAGCTDYLAKPADRQQLIQMILKYTPACIEDGAGI